MAEAKVTRNCEYVRSLGSLESGHAASFDGVSSYFAVLNVTRSAFWDSASIALIHRRLPAQKAFPKAYEPS